MIKGPWQAKTESGIDFQAEAAGMQKPDIQDVIAALKQGAKLEASAVGATVIYGLSSLPRQELKAVESTWIKLPSTYKHKVLQALNEASEANFELCYREIALLSVEDESSLPRAAAVDLLWEEDSAETMRLFLKMARDDAASHVRARALIGLGKFILLGEYGEIPAALALEAQELAIRLHCDANETVEVRRHALEALANSNHPDASRLIREAYEQGGHLLKTSALFAMGRTCDRQWQDILLTELESSDNELVYEAVRACGEIQLESSLDSISELALGDDREIQLMSVWALGEIGGKRAFEILSDLAEQADDDELADVTDEALDAASFSLSGPAFDFHFDDR